MSTGTLLRSLSGRIQRQVQVARLNASFSTRTKSATGVVTYTKGKRGALIPNDGKSLKDFVGESEEKSGATASHMLDMHTSTDHETAPAEKKSLSFFIETYGCQMNVADTEIVNSVLESSGHKVCNSVDEADVILTNTCAIRENAETKIWNRIAFFNSMKVKNRLNKQNVGESSFFFSY